jgi:hypothetical protein
MAKPAITKRNTKGSALTFTELDNNFQNLKDATITLKAGTAGTDVVSDLNGTITIVAGGGITLTGDNTAKTVTINTTESQNIFQNIAVAGQSTIAADTSTDTLTIVAGTNIALTTDSGTDTLTVATDGINIFQTIAVAGQSNIVADSVSDTLTIVAGSNVTLTTNAGTDTLTIATAVNGLTNPLVAELSTAGFDITAGSNITTGFVAGAFAFKDYVNENYALTITPDTTANIIEGHNDADLTIRNYNNAGQVANLITLDRNNLGIVISASNDASKSARVTFSGAGVTRHIGQSDSDIALLNVASGTGMMVYSTTQGNFQFYNGSAWINMLRDIVQDLTPQLGGDLDINGKKIITTGNNDIELDPAGSGRIKMSGPVINAELRNWNETVYSLGNSGAGTITPDPVNGNIQTLTATGNFTLGAISFSTGQTIKIFIKQDGTGGRTITFTGGGAYLHENGTVPTLSTGAGVIDVLTITGGTAFAGRLVSIQKGFA